MKTTWLKWSLPLLVIVALATVGAARAQQVAPADQQLAFADQLRQDGEGAAALLEYKRFLYYNPTHAKVPAVKLQMASVQLVHLGNVAEARRTFAAVIQDHPNTPEAEQAKGLLTYIETNSDFDGKPLVAYLKGRQAENRGQFAEAVALYLAVPRDFPQARLADDGLVDAMRLDVEQLNTPADTLKLQAQLERDYSRSSDRLIEATFWRAMAVEKTATPQEGIAAYEKVAPQDAKDPWRVRALDEAARLRKQKDVLQRTQAAELVRQFKLVEKGLTADKQYTVVIEVATALTPQEVQATIEDALLKNYTERPADAAGVVVAAYFNYPITKAGRATWQPGGQPAYAIEQRKAKDAATDLLFDVLKGGKKK